VRGNLSDGGGTAGLRAEDASLRGRGVGVCTHTHTHTHNEIRVSE
jgi:hypothetical protein